MAKRRRIDDSVQIDSFAVRWELFTMKAVLSQHLKSTAGINEEKDKEMIELMRDSFHVDDCISSVES